LAYIGTRGKGKEAHCFSILMLRGRRRAFKTLPRT